MTTSYFSIIDSKIQSRLRISIVNLDVLKEGEIIITKQLANTCGFFGWRGKEEMTTNNQRIVKVRKDL